MKKAVKNALNNAEKWLNRALALIAQNRYYYRITPATPLGLIRWAYAHFGRVFSFGEGYEALR